MTEPRRSVFRQAAWAVLLACMAAALLAVMAPARFGQLAGLGEAASLLLMAVASIAAAIVALTGG